MPTKTDKRKMTNHDVTTPWVDGTTGEVLSITWHYRRGAPLSFTFGPPLADMVSDESER